MGGEAGDGESGQAVAKAAFEQVAASEGGGRGQCDLERRGPSSLLEHLTCAQGGVALADHAMVMKGPAHGVVLYVARKRLHTRALLHLDGLVYVSSLPGGARS